MLYLVLGGIRGGLNRETTRLFCWPASRGAAGPRAQHLAVGHCFMSPGFKWVSKALFICFREQNTKVETKSLKWRVISFLRGKDSHGPLCTVIFALGKFGARVYHSLRQYTHSFLKMLSQVCVPRERALQLESEDLYSRRPLPLTSWGLGKYLARAWSSDYCICSFTQWPSTGNLPCAW